MKILRSRSIRARLFQVLVVAVGAVVVVAAVGWRLTVEPALRLGVAQQQREVARRAADQIDEFIEHRLKVLSTAADVGRLGQEDVARRREVLSRVLRSDGGLEEVSVVDRAGAEVARLSRTRALTESDLRGVAESSYFRRALDGDLYVGDVYHAHTAEPMVTIAVPIRLGTGAVGGVLAGEINLKTLWNAISHVKVGEAGYAFVVDRQGVLIAHPDHSRVLLRASMLDHPEVRRAVGHPESTAVAGRIETDGKGTAIISTAAVARRPGWAVVVEEPMATAFSEVHRLERLAVLLVLATVAGAFGISYWFSRRIGGPVRDLREGVERIADGDLAHRLSVATGDEIAELAGRFNEMADRLRASKRQVDEHLTTLQRALRVRSACAETLVRATEEAPLLETICETLVAVGGYCMAWAGRAEDDAARTVRRLAAAGPGVLGYIERVFVTWREVSPSRPMGVAIRTGHPCLVKVTDPAFARWRAEAERHGVAAILAVPLIVDGEPYGALGIYSREADAFDEAEVHLLASLAEDVSHGISGLRARADRATAEEHLRRRERRFRSLIEHSADAITLLDRDGRIVEVSPSAERLLGYAAGDMVGRPVRDFVHSDDEAAARRSLLAGHGRAPQRVVVRVQRADGTWRWVEAIQNDLLAEPDVNAVVINWWDITDRVQAEEERGRLEEQLRQAQKMEAIGRLAGGIAHDFNNLLTVITGRSELVQGQAGIDDGARRNLDLIHRTAERAAGLTRQLLAFSRKQVLQPTLLDLNEVVGEVASLLRRLVGEHIELVSVPAAGPVRVQADRSQVEQVLMNLAVNARDAMPDGGRLVLRTVAGGPDARPPRSVGAAPGPYVALAVSDTGVGMDEETRSHIFEPFFTTKAPGQGTGLGLSTVYGIVTQHGGHVAVDSTAGRGSTFTIYLPRAEGEAPTESAPDPAAGRGSEAILLVEDEPDVRDLAREILEEGGYRILEAGGPAEALRVCAETRGPIALLLTDVVMPGMSGRALADRVGQSRPRIKVLYMSGYTSDTIVSHGVLETGVRLLHKPFSPGALLASVRQALDAPVLVGSGAAS